MWARWGIKPFFVKTNPVMYTAVHLLGLRDTQRLCPRQAAGFGGVDFFIATNYWWVFNPFYELLV